MPVDDSGPGEDEETFEPPAIGETDDLASVIRVDRRDDIAAVCGRVDMTPTYAVVVYAPRGNRELASDLGMRRLIRHAEEGGKVIAIATKKRSLAGRARINGIPVARKPEHVRWDSGGRRVFRLAAFSFVIPRVGFFVQLAAIFFIVGLFAGLALTLAPSAIVIAVPPTEPVTETVSVRASKDRDKIDFTTLEVPAREVSASQKITLAVRTTGRLAVDTRAARVTVALTNPGRTDVIVPAGTKLLGGKDNLSVFALDANTPVAAGQTATQSATAAALGAAGNVAAATITKFQDAPLAASLRVTNTAAATGGATEDRAIVDEKDIASITALAKDLEKSEQLRQVVVRERPKDAVFLATAKASAAPGQFTPSLGSYAEVLLMEVEVRVTALAILSETVELLGARVLGQKHTDGTLIAGSTRAAQTGTAEIEKDTGAIKASLRLTGQFARFTTEDDIKNAVKGHSPGDAESILREGYGIPNPRVDLSPGWAPWLPRFTFRIDVKLSEPATETASTANDRTATPPATTAPAGAAPRP